MIEWLPDYWLIAWLISWLTDWLINWLIDWLIDWSIDWLADWYLLTLRDETLNDNKYMSLKEMSFGSPVKENKYICGV